MLLYIFFSADDKTFMKHFYIHKFSFKNVILLTMELKMYLKSLQKLRCLDWIHGLQPRDKAAMFGVNTIEFYRKNLSENSF